LPVREINLKECTPVILEQFILPGLEIEPADNRFRLSAHCANEPQRQARFRVTNCPKVTARWRHLNITFCLRRKR